MLDPADPDHALDKYGQFAVSGHLDGQVRIPWLAAEPPDGEGPHYLVPATVLEDPNPLDRLLAQHLQLPHLPASYQPYVDVLLERGAKNGLAVISDDAAALVSARSTHTPPGYKVWYRNDAVVVPVSLPEVGVNPNLAGKSFVLLGSGSLGSRVAELLAAAGVGQLVVVDPDTLAPRNLRRHLCGIEHLGRFKSEAVADELSRRGFETEVVPLVGRAQVALADKLRGLIASADGVICTTDSAPPRQFASHCAHHSKTVCVVADVQLRPEPLGEVVTSVPGAGGCFNCWRVELEAANIMLPPGGHDAADYPDAGGVLPSGLPLYQLSLVASVVCDLLSDGLAIDAHSSKWLMAMDGPVSDFPNLEAPKRVLLEALERHADCEVCR